MDDPGPGEWVVLSYVFELFTGYLALVAASTQPVSPRLLRMLKYRFQHFVVASDAVVLVVPTHLPAQFFTLFLQWHVSISITPLPYRLHRSPHTFARRHPLDHPVPPA